jgi:hypothetical protein
LLKDTTKKVDIAEIAGKGRGVRAAETTKKGDYVAEYKYSQSYPPNEKAQWESEYELNEEGMDVVLPGGKWLCQEITPQLAGLLITV